jgi:hypothetical protein
VKGFFFLLSIEQVSKNSGYFNELITKEMENIKTAILDDEAI